MDIRNDMYALGNLLRSQKADSSPAASRAPAASSRAASGASGTGEDRAELSLAASLVHRAADGDDIRSEKVDAVRAALADGSYSVPSSSVASKMIDQMLGR